MAHRTPAQQTNRRRVETLIGAVAPALDLLLYAGDRVSRVAGRNDHAPEPPRHPRPPRQDVARRPDRRAGEARLMAAPEPGDPQKQLEWEARLRPRAAVAAALGGGLIIGGQLGRGLALQDAPRRNFLSGLENLQAPGPVGDRASVQLEIAQFFDEHAIQLVRRGRRGDRLPRVRVRAGLPRRRARAAGARS